MQDLDKAASDGTARIVDGIKRELRRQCREKDIWIEMMKEMRQKNILVKQLEEAMEYAVGHHKVDVNGQGVQWPYTKAREVEDALKNEKNSSAITGDLLFEVFDEFVDIVHEETTAKERRGNLLSDTQQGTAAKESGKGEKEKDNRGGLNDLIGPTSREWSEKFHQQFQEYSDKAITPIYEAVKQWAFAAEDTKRTYLSIKDLKGAAPPASWFEGPGGQFVKGFAEKAARIMVQQAIKLTNNIEVPMEKMEKVTTPGEWGELGRSSAKTVSKTLQVDRTVDRQLLGRGGTWHRGGCGGRGGRGGRMAPLTATTTTHYHEERRGELTCHNCREAGHMAKDCQKPTFCYECGQHAGHIGRDCPQRKAKAAKGTREEVAGGVGGQGDNPKPPKKKKS